MADTFADHARLAEGLRGYALRDHWHGYGLALVPEALRGHGFAVVPHGIEYTDELKDLVRGQDDRCSLMLRFRPDLAGISSGWRAVLCEVKCPAPSCSWPEKFTIEARAWRALSEWNMGGNVAMLTYVLIRPNGHHRIGASWVSTLPEPETIWVPRRPGWERDFQAIGALYPASEVRDCIHNPTKSGTPFVTVHRREFCSLDRFITAEILPLGQAVPA